MKDYKEYLNPEADKNLSRGLKTTKFLSPSRQTQNIPFQSKTSQ